MTGQQGEDVVYLINLLIDFVSLHGDAHMTMCFFVIMFPERKSVNSLHEDPTLP